MTEKVEVKMEDGLVVVQESQVPVIYASKENIQIVNSISDGDVPNVTINY